MQDKQRVVLAALTSAEKALSPTIVVKLLFLLRQEPIFRGGRDLYDFVPYDFGPFSFSLHQDIVKLAQWGYVRQTAERIELHVFNQAERAREVQALPADAQYVIRQVVKRHGIKAHDDLLREVYAAYPWYATRSKRVDLQPPKLPTVPPAEPAVYTAGYEGKSIDRFLDDLLRTGVRQLIDVRSNPVSRAYGFAGKTLSGLTRRLGLQYRHEPELGVPSSERVGLGSRSSYDRVISRYRDEILPTRRHHVTRLAGELARTASVLMCVERDPQCCHRTPLAVELARVTGLPVRNL